jgi:hypothetical protein
LHSTKMEMSTRAANNALTSIWCFGQYMQSLLYLYVYVYKQMNRNMYMYIYDHEHIHI